MATAKAVAMPYMIKKIASTSMPMFLLKFIDWACCAFRRVSRNLKSQPSARTMENLTDGHQSHLC